MSWKKKAITISALSALTTFTIHLANKIIDISATSENHEQNAAGSYFDWKFGNIYYEKYGEGEPVLLIHDFSVGSSSYEWQSLINWQKAVLFIQLICLDAEDLINHPSLILIIYMCN